ncbi:MAG TPA: CBS domain-containing protein [Salinibacter sp.]|nr:CBS domain-containing protein [Salinibacter sp.]
MTVDTIMSRDVVTVRPDAALMEIRGLLHQKGFNHLLVTEEDDTLCGVISDRDVLKAISPFLDTYSEEHRDVKTLSQPASEIMQSEPITVTPDTTIKEASMMLLDNRVSSLPVVEGNELVGIVTGKDMLEYYISEDG